MTDTKAKKWNEQSVAQLLQTVGDASPVSVASLNAAAEVLGVTVRSVASKLRQLDREVASTAKDANPTFTADESDALTSFVQSNVGQLTYKDISEQFAGGKFTAKQVQGKLLALELTGKVKPAEKMEAARTYSEGEEATFVHMANAGKFIEEIATALGKSIPSVRGKALSLTRSGQISRIPAQKESAAKDAVDAVTALGDKIATMTVAEIAAAVGKTDRGVKTLLTRRGIDVADYKGSEKRAKAEAKATEVAA